MREERGNEMRQMKGKISKFETREDSEDLYISGYFAVFGSDYELWPGATLTGWIVAHCRAFQTRLR